jgi:hypothetical protein
MEWTLIARFVPDLMAERKVLKHALLAMHGKLSRRACVVKLFDRRSHRASREKGIKPWLKKPGTLRDIILEHRASWNAQRGC